MHLYTSGTPSNDRFQAVENQLCTHRLFSIHGGYKTEVFRWLRDVREGVQNFDDYCERTRDVHRRLEHDDRIARRRLQERGINEEWIPYAEALGAISKRLPDRHPKYIMLDSGAFTAWNTGATATLDEVRATYERFLTEAENLFEEVWLVNLDVIPGQKGREPTADETARAVAEMDDNLALLKSEFGDCVLPVFHQGEGQSRFLEVIDQAKGYLCLSPTNGIPEERRWR